MERFPAWQCAWLWESQPSLWLLRYFLSIHSFSWQIIDWARWREHCEWQGSYSHGVHHLGCTFHAHMHFPTRKACTSVWTSCGQCYILSLKEVLFLDLSDWNWPKSWIRQQSNSSHYLKKQDPWPRQAALPAQKSNNTEGPQNYNPELVSSFSLLRQLIWTHMPSYI